MADIWTVLGVAATIVTGSILTTVAVLQFWLRWRGLRPSLAERIEEEMERYNLLSVPEKEAMLKRVEGEFAGRELSIFRWAYVGGIGGGIMIGGVLTVLLLGGSAPLDWLFLLLLGLALFYLAMNRLPKGRGSVAKT